MRYEDLFIGVLIIILLIVAAVRVLSPKNSGGGRDLLHDSDGKLIAIGDRSLSTGRLTGRGAQLSDTLQLAAGTYRIDYQFDALTRLALVDANGDETLFIKRDTGTERFQILEAGRYRLLLEPTDDGAAWALEYRQMNTLSAE